jgi:glycerophosphoryl diester phosphodiesterase
MRPIILTHRGLDPSRENYFKESSMEAFADQLRRGFGLEFDLQLSKDRRLIIIHDDNIGRLTDGKDRRKINDITGAEILSMNFGGCHLTDLPTLLGFIRDKQSKECLSAIHLKHGSQEPATLDLILDHLKTADPTKFIVFDTKISTARYLKEHNPSLRLAPSVSHPYDIARYNKVTGGTLYAVNEILPLRKLFDWVWLDEWDLSDTNGGTKSLYNEEVFTVLRTAGLSIALVSPELHASSPGLLGGEAHPDAVSKTTLAATLNKILALSPDLICSDYPDMIRALTT